MNCVECNNEAKYIYWGMSLCEDHYQEHKQETEKAAKQYVNKN